MTKLYKRLWISLSDFLSKPPHDSIDVCGTWVAINSLRIDGPQAFNKPKVVPLCAEKKWMITLVPPKSWCVVWKMLFHELLICIGGVRLGEVLLEDHIFIALKKLSLIDGQTF